MSAKYFSVMATDGTPTFEPVDHFSGVWYGVAKVDDPEEIKRLSDRGTKEITEKEYHEAVEKKAQGVSSLTSLRAAIPQTAAEAARDAARAASDKKATTIEEVSTPGKVPRRTSSPI